MPHETLMSREFALGFVAGAAVITLVPHIPTCFGLLSKPTKKPKSKTALVKHLDSRGWAQKGRVLTDAELSQAQILAADEDTKKQTLRVDAKTVVKVSPNLNMNEVDNIDFIRAHTSIPAPRILNAYDMGGLRFILMEFVEGEQLEDAWPQLSPEERETIGTELQNYLIEMRGIPCPDAFIGSIAGGPAIDRRSSGPVKGGPFKSEEEFNDWQVQQLRDNVPSFNKDIYASLHQSNHEVVFSHGDLGFHNILVNKGHITGIIDWEHAGWFPEHWDFCKTFQYLAGSQDQCQFARKAFGKEFLREHFLDLWFTRDVKHGGW